MEEYVRNEQKLQVIFSDEIVKIAFAATGFLAFANMDSNGTPVGCPIHQKRICMHGSDI